jgi:prophage DNA circulation protein
MATEKWREKMKIYASFGGARFYVSTVEYQAGRQTKKHTFDKATTTTGKGIGPAGVGVKVDKAIAARDGKAVGARVSSSEDPYIEDLGGAPKMFLVTGYFLESNLEFGMPDYLDSRDLFIKKMSEGVARTLTLPTFGDLTCKPGKLSTKFSNKEGGIETFTAVFYRENINFQPFFTEDTKSVLGIESEVLLNILLDMAKDTFSVTEPPLSVTTAGIPGVVQIPEDIGLSKFVAEDTLSALDKFRNSIAGLTGYGKTKLAELNKLQQQLNGFSNNITELILAPSELASSMIAIVTQTSKIFVRPIDAFFAQRDLLTNFFSDLGSVLGDTLDAFSLRSNLSSIRSITENAAGSEMMRNASDIDFDSAEQALDTRDQMSDLIDDLQLRNADVISTGSPFLQMRTVLAASTRDITQRSATLPIVEYVELDESIPLLVVAYGLYEDATRFEAIATRNGIKNNLSPKTNLEVLSS